MARRDYLNDPHAPKANSIVPSVTAIVTNDIGELLPVHKTDNNRWSLPGGGMDPGPVPRGRRTCVARGRWLQWG